MFDEVASRYDLMNDVASLGQVRVWRAAVAAAVAAGPGDRILDLAAGTATSTALLRRDGASALACDFSLGMLSEARSRRPEIPCVAGDAMRLPFADGAFDVVTMSYGLRNVNDPRKALKEMLRVAKTRRALGNRRILHPRVGADAQAVFLLFGLRRPRAVRGVLLRRIGLRLPGRVDPRLARSSRLGSNDPGRRVAFGRVPKPDGRHRRDSQGRSADVSARSGV